MVKFTRVKSSAAPGPMRSTGKLTARMHQYEDYVNAVKSGEVGQLTPYEGDATRALAEELGYRPVVPPMRTRTQPWDYNRVLYRQRNQVERFFGRLKRFRRIATRYDKLDSVFLAFIHLAVIYDALQLT